jgi:endonuclease/exonuclease/phosphatase family metal-dependent hydrolase
VLPPEYLISKTELEIQGDKIIAGNQFKRTPFIASFKSGWLEFDICTVHLFYGSKTGEKLAHRVQEIDTIANYLSERADRALGDERALILLGDFNIVSPQHKTMRALLNNGFIVPPALQEKPTTDTAKHYDQIAFKTSPRVIRYMEEKAESPLQRSSGVVPLFERIFTEEQFDTYANTVRENTSAGRKATNEAELMKAYKKWRTFQFSDHYPMWVRLQTDSSDEFLHRISNQTEADN